ncbi:MAG: phage minor capsid protein [Saccharofermentans sp.]|nr:phage minor capsid protein [Saccharofermentans sp.]
MTWEDIGDIFQAMEDDLFAMAIRNMKRHEDWEKMEGFKWTQWQAEQITGLREYRKNVAGLTNSYFDRAKAAIIEFLKEAYKGSVDDARGFAALFGKKRIRPGFFGVNSSKLDIIINEAVQNIDTKRYAAINRMNSGYTDFLRKADIYAQSGSYTIPQAVDIASRDFLAAGLNCVEYRNGNRVNIASYAEMALRTSSSEVTRQANGDVRNELGEYLVVSNVIGMTCPICQEWQGKVMIDDVYSEGKPDGKHKLVSEAKAAGFLHPNCRHQLFMYIEGITEIAELPNDVENKEHYKAEQEQRRQEREIRKYKRLRDGAVDPADRQKYDARVKEWTQKHDEYLSEHPYLRKNPKRLAPGYTGNGKPMVAESSRKATEGDYGVNWPKIQSKEYDKAIRSVVDSEKASEAIKTRITWTLTNRDGKNTEEMYAVFSSGEKVGEEIGRVTNQNVPFGVGRDVKFIGKLKKADESGSPIIIIHNHPSSSPPSLTDLNELLSTKNASGMVAGHNGSVYHYTRPTREIPDSEFLDHYKDYFRQNQDKVAAAEYALKKLSEDYGFKVTKLI